MMRFALAALSAAFLAACSSVPTDYKFDAASQSGLLIIETAPAFKRPSAEGYSLYAGEFSVEERKMTGGGPSFMNIGKGKSPKQYYVARAAAGTYAFTELNVQASWHACFNNGTRYFDVKPGEVLFLGRVDPRPALFTIATTLPRSSMNSQHFFSLDTVKLDLTPPEQIPGWENGVAEFLKASYPNVTGSAVAAVTQPATFNTGYSLYGSRVCTGYFVKSDLKDAEKKKPE